MTRITKHQNNKSCSIIAINTDSKGGEGVSGDFISTTAVIKTKLISDQGKGAILEEECCISRCSENARFSLKDIAHVFRARQMK
jgi:hypothetical protein